MKSKLVLIKVYKCKPNVFDNRINYRSLSDFIKLIIIYKKYPLY